MKARRILVVEDIGIVAFDLAQSLEDAGAVVVGPACDLPTAVQFASREMIDGALLDVDLFGQRSFPVADVLLRRCIPFVFVTADTDVAEWPIHLQAQPRVSKPAIPSILINTLRAVIYQGWIAVPGSRAAYSI